jgi:serpin B
MLANMLDVRMAPITLVVGALLTGGCDDRDDRRDDQPELPQVHSDAPYDSAPQLEDAEVETLAGQNHALTLDLYHQLREGEAADGSFAISAYSIHSAFGMLYAGTVEPARSEMAESLHFSLEGERQHVAHNWLDTQLAARNLPAENFAWGDQAAVEVHTANGVWVLDDYADLISRDYLDMLAIHYNAGVFLADFDARPEHERMSINAWVSKRTAELIPELFPMGVIDRQTTLVLVNALYLKAPWANPFNQKATEPAPFFKLDGSQIEVQMMHDEALRADYGLGLGYQAIALPLRGEALELLIIVPDDFASFEAELDDATLASVREDMETTVVTLGLPKFQLEAQLELTDELRALGLLSPFVDDHSFDAILERLGIITTVVHQTVIEVDEKGTEAAAATGIVVTKTNALIPAVELVVDRPFLLAIRDAPTDTLLFFGRVLEP